LGDFWIDNTVEIRKEILKKSGIDTHPMASSFISLAPSNSPRNRHCLYRKKSLSYVFCDLSTELGLAKNVKTKFFYYSGNVIKIFDKLQKIL